MRKRSSASVAAVALAAAFGAAQAETETSAVRMSQVGFETQGPKTATVEDRATRPLPWRVVDRAGANVAQGTSKVFGQDAARAKPCIRSIFSRCRPTAKAIA